MRIEEGLPKVEHAIPSEAGNRDTLVLPHLEWALEWANVSMPIDPSVITAAAARDCRLTRI